MCKIVSNTGMMRVEKQTDESRLRCNSRLHPRASACRGIGSPKKRAATTSKLKSHLFKEMYGFFCGDKMCVPIHGVPFIPFAYIGSAPGAVGRNGSEDQLAVSTQNAGAFPKRFFWVFEKTQRQRHDYAVIYMLRKRQFFSASNTYPHPSPPGLDRHGQRNVNAMGDAESLCETACADTNFQPTAGVIYVKTAEAIDLLLEKKPSLRGLIPPIVSIGYRIKNWRSGHCKSLLQHIVNAGQL